MTRAFDKVLTRRRLEAVRAALMEQGYHFPNEELIQLDTAIVELGGKSKDTDAEGEDE